MVKNNINFKRAGYVGAALVLAAASVPIVPSGSAFADTTPCISSSSNSNLNNAVSSGSADVNLTLCAGNAFENYPYGLNPNATNSFTLDLNGNTLKLSTVAVKSGVTMTVKNGTILHGTAGGSVDQLFRNDNGGTLILDNITYAAEDGKALVRMNGGAGTTYIKSGNYANTGSLFSKNSASAKIAISGGIFNQDISTYVADGYAAYQNGSEWRVETKLTTSTFTISPAELTIKEGQVVDLLDYVTLPEDSTNTQYITGTGGSVLSDYVRMTDEKAASTKVTTIYGKKATGENGPVRVTIAPKYDKSVKQTFKVTVESGLKDIAVSDVTMLQEDTKTVTISNEYYYDRAEGVSYTAVPENDKIAAEVNGNELKITTGKNGVVEPGVYKVTVKALVDGVETSIAKDITVTVNKLFTDFTLTQADANGVIELKENEYFPLTVASALEADVDASNVAVESISVISGGDIMHANENRIAGDKKGMGTAKISVTAKYTSGENVYRVTKNFTVKVKSALANIAVREASDASNKGVKYGKDAGEIDSIMLDRGDSKDLKVSVDKSDAAVDVKVTSGNNKIVKVEQDGKNFKLVSVKAGTATITVNVTPKGGKKSDTLTKTFDVVVNSILETLTLADTTISLYEEEEAPIIIKAVNEKAIKNQVTWTYSGYDKTIIEVSADGKIKAKKEGTTSVIVKGTFVSPLGKTYEATAKARVTVKPILKQLNVDDLSVVKGGLKRLDVDYESSKILPMITFTSSDKRIATVDALGIVRGVSAGTTSVIVTAFYHGKTIKTEALVDVYEMVKPSKVNYYGEVGSEWEIEVSDKNPKSVISSVVSGDGLEINENKVKVVKPGLYTITYTDKMENGNKVGSYTASFLAYAVEMSEDDADDTEGVAAETLKGILESLDDVDGIRDALALSNELKAAFGEGLEGYRTAFGIGATMLAGEKIMTSVEVESVDVADADTDLVEFVEGQGVSHVDYYDISVVISSESGRKLGQLHELDSKIRVAIATVTDPEDGYTREYLVMRKHGDNEPEILVEGEDFYIEDGTLYAISDKFSQYAVAYIDTLLPKTPDTGARASEGASATSSLAALVAGVLAMITLAGVAVFTKRK